MDTLRNTIESSVEGMVFTSPFACNQLDDEDDLLLFGQETSSSDPMNNFINAS
jgi:hypothetical protein